jgi:hypothetical protein
MNGPSRPIRRRNFLSIGSRGGRVIFRISALAWDRRTRARRSFHLSRRSGREVFISFYGICGDYPHTTEAARGKAKSPLWTATVKPVQQVAKDSFRNSLVGLGQCAKGLERVERSLPSQLLEEPGLIEFVPEGGEHVHGLLAVGSILPLLEADHPVTQEIARVHHLVAAGRDAYPLGVDVQRRSSDSGRAPVT